METLTGFSRKHPQSDYVELQKSLQKDWAFVQQVTAGIGDAFGRVKKALREAFLLALFDGIGEGAPERGVTCLPKKQAGLALPYQTLTAPGKCLTSCVITGHLVAALRGQVKFWTAYQSSCL